ncbi:MAG: VWA domain-containing protein [Candidatus Hermodarchaeota archaeon]
MPKIKVEDTVILLDTSRSMLRKDFKPSRLTVELQAAKNFIKSKLAIDLKDRISIISFGATEKRLIDFAYDIEKLNASMKKVQISGKGILHEAISFALQVLVEEMRKLGGKTPRILIITDNKLKFDLNRLEKVINIAKGLGVYIDICQLGGTQEHEKLSLKRIAQLTRGFYSYFNNSKEFLDGIKTFAPKKEVRETSDYFAPEKKEDIAPLISEIALPLRRPTVLEIKLIMNGKSNQEKCHICHSIKAPATGSDFYSEGRFCPSCDRGMHLSCAAMWAKKTETMENIFRCPFCFFLLELPRAALKFVKEIEKESQEIRILEEEKGKTTHMELIPDPDVDQIDASCSYCHNIFLGDYKVYQCDNCGSYYHQPCLEKMRNEIKACRYCGARIVVS